MQTARTDEAPGRGSAMHIQISGFVRPDALAMHGTRSSVSLASGTERERGTDSLLLVEGLTSTLAAKETQKEPTTKEKKKKSKFGACFSRVMTIALIPFCLVGAPCFIYMLYLLLMGRYVESSQRKGLETVFWLCFSFVLLSIINDVRKGILFMVCVMMLLFRAALYGWGMAMERGVFMGMKENLLLRTSIACLSFAGFSLCCYCVSAIEEARKLGRRLVSQKKRRFVNAKLGVDLDLTYIIPGKLIAMGWPTEDYLEQQFRNPMDQVQKLLKVKHSYAHMVFNLCSERVYNKKAFEREHHTIRFPDHQVCPLWKMPLLCKAMEEFYKADRKNVVVVHCKAGKGRTGMVVAAFLLHIHKCKRAADALAYYDRKRTYNGKGVTIPSQIRWVGHYEAIVREQGLRPPVWLNLVRVEALPEIEEPWRLQIMDGDSVVIFDSARRTTPPLLEGDLKFVAFLGKTKLWQTWIHTRYDPSRVVSIASANPMFVPSASTFCDKGHKTKFIQAYVGGTCDVCGEVLQRGETLFECRVCDPIWWHCGRCQRPEIAKRSSFSPTLKDPILGEGSIVTENSQELDDFGTASLSPQPSTVVWRTDKHIPDNTPGWMCAIRKLSLDGPHKNKGDKLKYKLRDGFDDAAKIRARAVMSGVSEVRIIFAEATQNEIRSKKLDEERARMEKDKDHRSDLRTVAMSGAGILEGSFDQNLEIKDYDDLENDTDNEEFLTILYRGYLLRRLNPCVGPVRRLCELHTTGRLHISGRTFFDTLVVNISSALPDRIIMPDPDGPDAGVWWVRNHTWEWLKAEDETSQAQWHEAFVDVLRFSISDKSFVGNSSIAFSTRELEESYIFRGFFSQLVVGIDPAKLTAVMADQWRTRLFVLCDDGRLVLYSYRERGDIVFCDMRDGNFSIKMLNTALRGVPTNMVVFQIPAAGSRGQWRTLAARHEDFRVFEAKSLELSESLKPSSRLAI